MAATEDFPEARCDRCGWSLAADGREVRDIARVTVKLELHLTSIHGVAAAEAMRIAEAWALEALSDGDDPRRR